MSDRRPYVRPTNPNWWSSPTYRHYTIRELTGLAVAIYGLVLFSGLASLAFGPRAYEAFLGFLRSPLSSLLHFVLLAVVVWHVITWCKILPKTMPKLILKGKPVPQEKITQVANVVMVSGSVVLLLLAVGAASR